MAQARHRSTEQSTSGKRSSAAERRAARAAQIKLEQQQRRRRQLMLLAAGALVLAIAAFFAIRAVEANRIGVPVPSEGEGHVDEGTELTYKHYPPSSGKHFNTPQPAGIYREEVPEGKFLHSLEHGYVVVLLKCPDGCPDLYEKFTELYNSGDLKKSQFGNVKFIVTPYSKPFSNPADEAPITLLAWNHELMLKEFDRDKIIRFYERYVDKGPELVP